MTDAAVRRSGTGPRPRFPVGWSAVAASADVADGTAVERTFCDERVVAFRGDGGGSAVLSAHCPHLGADLGRGGRVVGDAIRCPFHSLRWDAEGACVGSEYPGEPDYPVRPIRR